MSLLYHCFSFHILFGFLSSFYSRFCKYMSTVFVVNVIIVVIIGLYYNTLRDDNCITHTLSLKLQLFQVSLLLMTLLGNYHQESRQEQPHLSTTSSTSLHASPPTDFTFFHHAKMKEYVCSV